MRKDSFLKAGASALLAAVLAAACTDNDTDIRSTATVALVDTTGKNVGTATLAENNAGIVTVTVEVTGLPAGEHGIHFHEVGIADPNAKPPFSTAGEHYNPGGEEHGLENPNGTHAGDLPNLLINSQGTGTLQTTTNRISISDGPRTLLDANGSTLIIHVARDDQRTNPAGNSGGRIAGGVVVRN
jgi:Cu-Zn family superoxide dismutase